MRAFALLGAILLSLSLTTSALANPPPGTVTVSADGCSFSVHIDLDQAYDLIGWKIKEFNAANWNDGKTLFNGQGPTDADGVVDLGRFTAPEGHYNVVVDDEYPPDGSSIVVDFTLSCPQATPTPTATPTAPPTATPTLTPTATPTGDELPLEGTPPPSGGVAGAHGTPRVTPPPTDTMVPSQTAGGSGLVSILLGLATLSVAILLATSRRAFARVGRNRR